MNSILCDLKITNNVNMYKYIHKENKGSLEVTSREPKFAKDKFQLENKINFGIYVVFSLVFVPL